MPNLDDILTLLIDEQSNLTPAEVVDLLWFFVQVAPTAGSHPEAPLPAPEDGETVTDGSAPPADDRQTIDDLLLFDDEEMIEEVAADAAEATAGVHLPGLSAGGPRGMGGGIAFRSPGVAALPDALGLARALRPLMRRRPSRTTLVLDEAGTAERIAAEGVLLPKLRPASTRWFEIALVVDTSASMTLWQSTLLEFQHLLERQGAFRDVRAWSLMTDCADGVVRLYPGIGRIDPERAHQPTELIDPNGKRLIVVVSDCVATAWFDGTMATLLAQWQPSGPLAVLQVLPRNVWRRTALHSLTAIELRSFTPGGVNERLVARSTAPFQRRLPATGLKIPVLNFDAESLKSWARTVMAVGGATISGRLWPIVTLPPAAASVEPVARSPQERVIDFQATASTLAWQLARLLATLPRLTLPLMRLIQTVMLPESQQIHLAEVFIGGLLREIGQDTHHLHPDAVQYRFIEGVADELTDGVASYDALAAVSLFIEQRYGQPINFFALLEDPGQTLGDLDLGGQASEFASLTASALRRIGGTFTQVAAELERGPHALAPSARPAGGAGRQGKATRMVTVRRKLTDEERIGRLNDRAEELKIAGSYAEAEPYYLAALKLAAQVWALPTPETLQIMLNTAGLYQVWHNYDQANRFYQQALALASAIPALDPLQIAGMANNFGTFLQAQGRYKEAEPYFQQALSIREQALGPNHPDVATVLNSLAGLMETMGEDAQAIKHYQQALDMLEHATGYEELFRQIVNKLARLLMSTRRYDEAERVRRRFNDLIDRELARSIERQNQRNAPTSLDTYVDFVVEIEPTTIGAYLVRAESSAGRYHATITLPTLNEIYTDFIMRLANGMPIDRTQEQAVGKQLYETLFQGSIHDAFRAARDEARRNGKTLRIKLVIDSARADLIEAAAVPWEFAVSADGVPLATEYAFSRYVARATALPKPEVGATTLTVLLAWAMPSELATLYPDTVEAAAVAIQTALKPLEAVGKLRIIVEPHLTIRQLQRRIKSDRPQVLHFIGHGVFKGGVGALVLEKPDGSRQDMPVDLLVDNVRSSSVRLVVLNTSPPGTVWFSGMDSLAPAVLEANIPAVVAIQSSPHDQENRVFAEGFYTALAENTPIDVCVSRGRRAIRLNMDTRDWGLIRLYTRSSDSLLFQGWDGYYSEPGTQQSASGEINIAGVNVGATNIYGNISIGNIVGGDIISGEQTKISQNSTLATEDLQQLQKTHLRNLEILERQAAGFGSLHMPVHLQNQLNDTREELARIEAELAQRNRRKKK